MNWLDAQTKKPLDDTDCLVMYILDDNSKGYRAPVFWNNETCLWHDEWNHTFKPEEIIKYILLDNL